MDDGVCDYSYCVLQWKIRERIEKVILYLLSGTYCDAVSVGELVPQYPLEALDKQFNKNMRKE